MKRLILLSLLVLLALPATAFGDTTVHSRPGLALSQIQLWAVFIGILSPIVGYVINTGFVKRLKANVPEPILALVHVVVAAVAAGVYTAVQANNFGWNSQTLQLIGTAVVTAFVAHGVIWKPAGVTARLATPRGDYR